MVIKISGINKFVEIYEFEVWIIWNMGFVVLVVWRLGIWMIIYLFFEKKNISKFIIKKIKKKEKFWWIK